MRQQMLIIEIGEFKSDQMTGMETFNLLTLSPLVFKRLFQPTSQPHTHIYEQLHTHQICELKFIEHSRGYPVFQPWSGP